MGSSSVIAGNCNGCYWTGQATGRSTAWGEGVVPLEARDLGQMSRLGWSRLHLCLALSNLSNVTEARKSSNWSGTDGRARNTAISERHRRRPKSKPLVRGLSEALNTKRQGPPKNLFQGSRALGMGLFEEWSSRGMLSHFWDAMR